MKETIKIIKIKNLTNGYVEASIGGNKTIYFNPNDPIDKQVIEITEGEFRNIDPTLFSCGYLGIIPSFNINKNCEMDIFSTYRDSKFTLTNLFGICARVLAINLDNELCLIASRKGMEYLLNNYSAKDFEYLSFKINDVRLHESYECISVEPKNRFRKKWFSDEPHPLAGAYYFKL